MPINDGEARVAGTTPARATLVASADGHGNLAVPRRKASRPPHSARCSACGNGLLSAVPTFSAGSGVAARPFAEHVICHGCGFIGPPTLIVP